MIDLPSTQAILIQLIDSYNKGLDTAALKSMYLKALTDQIKGVSQ
jgi:hypothetical protein